MIVLKSLEITLTEFCCKITVTDVIKDDNPLHGYKANMSVLVDSIIFKFSRSEQVIIGMPPCRWVMCLTLHVQSGTQLFISPAVSTGAVLKTAFDVLHQPCSGFPEVCLCKAMMWEGPLVDMFLRAFSWMMI